MTEGRRIFFVFLVGLLSFSIAAYSLTDEEEKFYVAGKAFSDGFYKAADALFRKFIRDFPESKNIYEAKLYIAKGLCFREDYTNAEEFFIDVIDGCSEKKLLESAYNQLIGIYFRRKNYAGLTALGRRYFNDYPKGSLSAQSCFYLGEASYAYKELDKAMVYYQQALNLGAADDINFRTGVYLHKADTLYEMGRVNDALTVYRDIVGNFKDSAAVYLDYIQFQMGMIFLKTRKWEEAASVLRNLKDNFPSSPLLAPAQYYLAAACFSKGEYQETKNLLKDFMDKFPDNDLISKVYYLYGKCLLNNQEYSSAIEAFKKLMGKVKDREIEELVYIDMGNAYVNLGLFDEAKKIWEEFLSIFPSSEYGAAAALYLGGLYEKENNSPPAEKYYKMAANDSKESVLSGKARIYLARIYAQEGRTQEAFTLYDELINCRLPLAKDAVLDKAFLLKEVKNYREAIELFSRAVNEGLDSSKLRFAKGLCWEKSGNNKEAIADYFKIIYMFSDDEYKVKAYFRIAKLYEKEANFAAAKEIYRQIAALGIGEAEIAKARLAELE